MLSVDFLGDTCFLVSPFVKPLVRLHLCVVEVGAEAVVDAAFDFQLEAETLEWIETSDCLNVSFKNKEKVNKHSVPNLNSPLQNCSRLFSKIVQLFNSSKVRRTRFFRFSSIDNICMSWSRRNQD